MIVPGEWALEGVEYVAKPRGKVTTPMPLLDQIRANKLIQLARDHFAAELSEAELKVLRDSASSEDLPEPYENAPRPELRAAFLRWLATDQETAPLIDPKGLRVYGFTISNKLDLEASRISVRLDFRHCTLNGELNLEQAQTQDILFLHSSLEGGHGFRADTIDVHGVLQLKESCFTGEIRLGGARVKGDLECDGAMLNVKGGNALFADGAEIEGDVFLRDGFESSGKICLPGAKIKGDLSCSGAKLRVAKGNALVADGAEIGGNALFSKNFEATGKISLRGTRVGGEIAFFGASVAQIDCTNLEASGDLYWLGVGKSSATHLDLRGASVKNLCDDEDSWPQESYLSLNGLAYAELTLHIPPSPKQIEDKRLPKPLQLDAGEGTRKRIDWLCRQPDDQRFKPQPWIQLSRYLEARGQHREAKHVLYEQKCLQAHHRWPGRWFWARWTSIAFAYLEESLARIFIPIAMTLLLGTLIFSGAHRSGAMMPAGDKAAAEHYPPFQPFIYALENALPMAKLGMDDKWTPNPAHTPQPWFPRRHRLDWLRVFNSYWFLAVSRWLLIFLGWFQAAVLGAALLGRFKP